MGGFILLENMAELLSTSPTRIPKNSLRTMSGYSMNDLQELLRKKFAEMGTIMIATECKEYHATAQVLHPETGKTFHAKLSITLQPMNHGTN